MFFLSLKVLAIYILKTIENRENMRIVIARRQPNILVHNLYS